MIAFIHPRNQILCSPIDKYHVDDIAMPKDIEGKVDAKEYCGTEINEALLKQLICGGATGSSPQPITERLILDLKTKQ